MTNLEKVKNTTKQFIVAADEVGWGALAGKLVICGVKAPANWTLEGLRDSKKLSERQRNIMRAKILDKVNQQEISYIIAERTNKEIDSQGCYNALKDCYAEVFTKLACQDSLLIADGNIKFDKLAQQGYEIISLIKADDQVPAVMAASILAKTYRDNEMIELDKQYPGYDFCNSKGYASPLHKDGLRKLGFSDLHRMSYKVKL